AAEIERAVEGGRALGPALSALNIGSRFEIVSASYFGYAVAHVPLVVHCAERVAGLEGDIGDVRHSAEAGLWNQIERVDLGMALSLNEAYFVAGDFIHIGL